MPVRAGARAVIVAALGHMKADVMQDALEDDTRRTPVAELLRRAPSAVVMLDRAAARL
jgi:6-phosphogluconolactonase/glucosamine-6-phosphate isomerase/deaminase